MTESVISAAVQDSSAGCLVDEEPMWNCVFSQAALAITGRFRLRHRCVALEHNYN